MRFETTEHLRTKSSSETIATLKTASPELQPLQAYAPRQRIRGEIGFQKDELHIVQQEVSKELKKHENLPPPKILALSGRNAQLVYLE
jgi:hypothetical protein